MRTGSVGEGAGTHPCAETPAEVSVRPHKHLDLSGSPWPAADLDGVRDPKCPQKNLTPKEGLLDTFGQGTRSARLCGQRRHTVRPDGSPFQRPGRQSGNHAAPLVLEEGAVSCVRNTPG